MIPDQVQTVSTTDQLEGERLLAKVDSLLDTVRAMYDTLQVHYAEIGAALLDVRNTKAWMLRGYRT